MKLKGKVAIVTGAGRGMGRAIAEGYALEGASLVLTAAREKKELDETAERLNALGILADVSKEDDAEKVVQAALQRFDHIDILVNNAGRGMKYVSPAFMTEPTRFWEIDPKIWRHRRVPDDQGCRSLPAKTGLGQNYQRFHELRNNEA